MTTVIACLFLAAAVVVAISLLRTIFKGTPDPMGVPNSVFQLTQSDVRRFDRIIKEGER